MEYRPLPVLRTVGAPRGAGELARALCRPLLLATVAVALASFGCTDRRAADGPGERVSEAANAITGGTMDSPFYNGLLSFETYDVLLKGNFTLEQAARQGRA